MRNFRALLALAPLVAFASGCALFQGGPEPVQTGYMEHTYQSPSYEEPRRYAMFVPADYNDHPGDHPLILFLHGYGESGDDISLVGKHGPIKVAQEDPDFDFLVVAPQVRQPPQDLKKITNAWRDYWPDVEQILAEVQANYRVDPSRIYLTGLSMGGFGSFRLAADHPHLWAAVAPICGGGELRKIDAYEGKPFWIFHGEKDPLVPFNASKQMYERMKRKGYDVRFTLYPDLLHDSWTRTYANPELYQWLKSHSLAR